MAEDKENNIEKMEAALAKANKEAQRYREELQATAAERDQLLEEKQQWGKRTEILDALTAAGVRKPGRLVNLVDTEKPTEEAIAALREDYPEFFKPSGSVDIEDKPAEVQTTSASDKQAEALLAGLH